MTNETETKPGRGVQRRNPGTDQITSKALF